MMKYEIKDIATQDDISIMVDLKKITSKAAKVIMSDMRMPYNPALPLVDQMIIHFAKMIISIQQNPELRHLIDKSFLPDGVQVVGYHIHDRPKKLSIKKRILKIPPQVVKKEDPPLSRVVRDNIIKPKGVATAIAGDFHNKFEGFSDDASVYVLDTDSDELNHKLLPIHNLLILSEEGKSEESAIVIKVSSRFLHWEHLKGPFEFDAQSFITA